MFLLVVPLPIGMLHLHIWSMNSNLFPLHSCLVLVIPLPMGMGPGNLYIWSMQFKIAISFELVLLLFIPLLVGMGPSGAWIIWSYKNISLELVSLLMIPLPLGMGNLHIWSMNSNVPFTPVNVFAAYDTVAHGHGPSKACIFLWAWGAYIFEASTSTYII